jgi:hypothetical protein
MPITLSFSIPGSAEAKCSVPRLDGAYFSDCEKTYCSRLLMLFIIAALATLVLTGWAAQAPVPFTVTSGDISHTITLNLQP